MGNERGNVYLLLHPPQTTETRQTKCNWFILPFVQTKKELNNTGKEGGSYKKVDGKCLSLAGEHRVYVNKGKISVKTYRNVEEK